ALLALLALQPHSKKVMGSIPAWGAVGSGAQVLPRPSVLRWAISRPFLCGVCMFSPCSQGVSSTKDPNSKNMQNNRTHDGQFTSLGPRPLQAAHCSWAVLEEGRSRMGKKAENKFTATSGLPACVRVC